MHNYDKFGNKSLEPDFKGRFISAIIVLLIFCIYIFVKAENLTKYQLSDDEKLSYGISLSQTLNLNTHNYFNQEGIASWYGKKFHKSFTASGEKYDMYKYTAAHRKLPFGTILRVVNKDNGKKTLVRINDRGPFIGKRVIDLSYQSAKTISGLGLPNVMIEGFLPSLIGKEIDEIKYYYAYSYDYPLVCLPENTLILKDSAKTFEEAINLYDSYLELYKR